MDRLAERAALKRRIRQCTDPLGRVTMVIDGGPGFCRTRTYTNPPLVEIERDAEFETVWANAPVQVYLQEASNNV